MHHFAFLCEPASPSITPQLSSSEISELGFFDRSGLPCPISDFTIRRIDDALAGNPVATVTRVGPRRWFE